MLLRRSGSASIRMTERRLGGAEGGFDLEQPPRGTLNAPHSAGAPRAERDRLAAAPEAARLGNPSYVWRFGQDRRLDLIERYVTLAGRRVLDLGCGVGEYVRAFER